MMLFFWNRACASQVDTKSTSSGHTGTLEPAVPLTPTDLVRTEIEERTGSSQSSGARSSGVQGYVYSASGQPLEGVEINLWRAGVTLRSEDGFIEVADEKEQSTALIGSAVTRVDGSFGIAKIARSDRLILTGAYYRNVEIRFPVSGGVLLNVVMGDGGKISGSLTCLSHSRDEFVGEVRAIYRGIPGLTVVSRVDSSGKFNIHGLPLGSYTVAPHALNGHGAVGEQKISLLSAQSSSWLNMPVVATVQVAGIVVDAGSGDAIPAAEITILGMNPGSKTHSDQMGKYSMDAVFPKPGSDEGEVQVYSEASGFHPAITALVVGEPGVIRMQRVGLETSFIHGEAVDALGHPMEYALVEATGIRKDSQGEQDDTSRLFASVTCTSQGWFQIPWQPSRDTILTITAKDYGVFKILLGEVINGIDLHSVLLPLASERVAFQVFDDMSNPVEGVRLQIRYPSNLQSTEVPTPPIALLSSSEYTNSDGYCEINHFGIEHGTLVATHGIYGEWEFPYIANGKQPMPVILHNHQSIILTVRAATGDPVEQFELDLYDSRGRIILPNSPMEVLESNNGQVQIVGRFDSPFAAVLRVNSSMGYGVVKHRIEPNSTGVVTVDLPHSFPLHGLVLDAQGRPVSDAAICLEVDNEYYFVVARTGVDGRFETRLFPGHLLWVSARLNFDQESSRCRVIEGEGSIVLTLP